mmetsp:Transcript_8154/g.11875  ORF Transcript_8154/g.11875 Transcript_8154/m.11875 type:complete len:274 (-) Transcript_8154:484-1305(-)
MALSPTLHEKLLTSGFGKSAVLPVASKLPPLIESYPSTACPRPKKNSGSGELDGSNTKSPSSLVEPDKQPPFASQKSTITPEIPGSPLFRIPSKLRSSHTTPPTSTGLTRPASRVTTVPLSGDGIAVVVPLTRFETSLSSPGWVNPENSSGGTNCTTKKGALELVVSMKYTPSLFVLVPWQPPPPTASPKFSHAITSTFGITGSPLSIRPFAFVSSHTTPSNPRNPPPGTMPALIDFVTPGAGVGNAVLLPSLLASFAMAILELAKGAKPENP